MAGGTKTLAWHTASAAPARTSWDISAIMQTCCHTPTAGATLAHPSSLPRCHNVSPHAPAPAHWRCSTTLLPRLTGRKPRNTGHEKRYVLIGSLDSAGKQPARPCGAVASVKLPPVARDAARPASTSELAIRCEWTLQLRMWNPSSLAVQWSREIMCTARLIARLIGFRGMCC